MKLPSVKPNSSAFMVFAMLLVGVFAAALVIIFDYWFEVDKRSISLIVLRKLRENDLPLIWISVVAGLTLMSTGFFLYLLSFFMLTAPAFAARQFMNSKRTPDNDLFLYASDLALKRFLPVEVVAKQGRKFRDGFMYILLTSRDSVTASTTRFSFTQLMYSRSLGTFFVLYTAYICWVLATDLNKSIALVAISWVGAVSLYGLGLTFFETVMISGILVERLHTDTEVTTQMEVQRQEPSLPISLKARRNRSRVDEIGDA